MNTPSTSFNRTDNTSLIGGIIVSALLIIGTWISVTNDWFPLLDYLNLIFHEAGHWIWGIFGEMMGFLGGSLNQIFIPLLCVLVLAYKKKWFSSAACLWWMGQSMINVSVYIGDARVRSLQLLGGDNVVHDWYWILGMWGQRENDISIASGVWWAGTVLMSLSIVFVIVVMVINNKKNKITIKS